MAMVVRWSSRRPLGQRAASGVFHGHVEHALGLTGLVQPYDVAMAQTAQQLHLAQEASDELSILGQVGREHLQSHVVASAHMYGAIHRAHATADFGEYPILSQLRAYEIGHFRTI